MKALLALAIVAASAIPTSTYAGDKEWATAGKILTGVVGLQVLNSAHKRSHSRSQSQRTVYTPTHYQPAPVRYQPARCKPTPVRHVSYRNSHQNRHYRSYKPAVVHHTKTVIVHQRAPVREYVPVHRCEPVRAYRPVAPVCNTPIISQVNSTRRIFQPRIRGHIAYLQILDQGEWSTLREYPSIF